jgi:hypothetical protein
MAQAAFTGKSRTGPARPHHPGRRPGSGPTRITASGMRKPWNVGTGAQPRQSGHSGPGRPGSRPGGDNLKARNLRRSPGPLHWRHRVTGMAGPGPGFLNSTDISLALSPSHNHQIMMLSSCEMAAPAWTVTVTVRPGPGPASRQPPAPGRSFSVSLLGAGRDCQTWCGRHDVRDAPAHRTTGGPKSHDAATRDSEGRARPTGPADADSPGKWNDTDISLHRQLVQSLFRQPIFLEFGSYPAIYSSRSKICDHRLFLSYSAVCATGHRLKGSLRKYRYAGDGHIFIRCCSHCVVPQGS